MISDKLFEKIRTLCHELDNLSQENFDKGMKLHAASKAETSPVEVPHVISQKEYERLSKNKAYTHAAKIIGETLALLEELDNVEWIYNDKIRKLYYNRPEQAKTADDKTVYSLEPPFTRSKFLS